MDGLVGRTDSEIFPEAVAENLTRLKKDVLSGSGRRHAEIEISNSEGLSWFEIWLDPLRNVEGSIVGIVTTATEITEQRLREQTLRTLLREVSHRSKVFEGILAETEARGPIAKFLDEDRLAALRTATGAGTSMLALSDSSTMSGSIAFASFSMPMMRPGRAFARVRRERPEQ